MYVWQRPSANSHLVSPSDTAVMPASSRWGSRKVTGSQNRLVFSHLCRSLLCNMQLCDVGFGLLINRKIQIVS